MVFAVSYANRSGALLTPSMALEHITHSSSLPRPCINPSGRFCVDAGAAANPVILAAVDTSNILGDGAGNASSPAQAAAAALALVNMLLSTGNPVNVQSNAVLDVSSQVLSTSVSNALLALFQQLNSTSGASVTAPLNCDGTVVMGQVVLPGSYQASAQCTTKVSSMWSTVPLRLSRC